MGYKDLRVRQLEKKNKRGEQVASMSLIVSLHMLLGK